MIREQDIIDARMWDAISPGIREEWAIIQAARTDCVLDAARLFVRFSGGEGEAIKQDIKTELEPLLVRFGRVPAERCDEVFELAEAQARQEMEVANEGGIFS